MPPLLQTRCRWGFTCTHRDTAAHTCIPVHARVHVCTLHTETRPTHAQTRPHRHTHPHTYTDAPAPARMTHTNTRPSRWGGARRGPRPAPREASLCPRQSPCLRASPPLYTELRACLEVPPTGPVRLAAPGPRLPGCLAHNRPLTGARPPWAGRGHRAEGEPGSATRRAVLRCRAETSAGKPAAGAGGGAWAEGLFLRAGSRQEAGGAGSGGQRRQEREPGLHPEEPQEGGRRKSLGTSLGTRGQGRRGRTRRQRSHGPGGGGGWLPQRVHPGSLGDMAAAPSHPCSQPVSGLRDSQRDDVSAVGPSPPLFPRIGRLEPRAARPLPRRAPAGSPLLGTRCWTPGHASATSTRVPSSRTWLGLGVPSASVAKPCLGENFWLCSACASSFCTSNAVGLHLCRVSGETRALLAPHTRKGPPAAGPSCHRSEQGL